MKGKILATKEALVAESEWILEERASAWDGKWCLLPCEQAADADQFSTRLPLSSCSVSFFHRAGLVCLLEDMNSCCLSLAAVGAEVQGVCVHLSFFKCLFFKVPTLMAFSPVVAAVQ